MKTLLSLIALLLLAASCGPVNATVTTVSSEPQIVTASIDVNNPPTPIPLSSIPPLTGMPAVRASGLSYSKADVNHASRAAEGSALSHQSASWATAHTQEFIDNAVRQAASAGFNADNLKEILERLLLRFNPAEFTGKNKMDDGALITFMLSTRTIQLPYSVEKARFEGKDAWIIVLNWEMKDGGGLGHIAAIAYAYGTTEVLFAASCA